MLSDALYILLFESLVAKPCLELSALGLRCSLGICLGVSLREEVPLDDHGSLCSGGDIYSHGGHAADI
eukprot:5228051-Pyramimonas_sp.AAC.1